MIQPNSSDGDTDDAAAAPIISSSAEDPDDEKVDSLHSEVSSTARDETSVDITVISIAGTEATVKIPVTNTFNTSETV